MARSLKGIGNEGIEIGKLVCDFNPDALLDERTFVACMAHLRKLHGIDYTAYDDNGNPTNAKGRADELFELALEGGWTRGEFLERFKRYRASERAHWTNWVPGDILEFGDRRKLYPSSWRDLKIHENRANGANMEAYKIEGIIYYTWKDPEGRKLPFEEINLNAKFEDTYRIVLVGEARREQQEEPPKPKGDLKQQILDLTYEKAELAEKLRKSDSDLKMAKDKLTLLLEKEDELAEAIQTITDLQGELLQARQRISELEEVQGSDGRSVDE